MKNFSSKKKEKKKHFILRWGIGFTLGIWIVWGLTHPSQIKDRSTGKTIELVRGQQHYQFIAFEQLVFPNKYLHAVNKVVFPDHPFSRSVGPDADPFDKAQIDIPERIKALDGKKIAIEGFMVPLEQDGDNNLKMFLLVDQIVDCLFCQGVGITQWVMTTVGDPNGFHVSGSSQYEHPITVYGTLEVGAAYKDGHLDSIYRMKTDGIEHRNFFFDSSF